MNNVQYRSQLCHISAIVDKLSKTSPPVDVNGLQIQNKQLQTCLKAVLVSAIEASDQINLIEQKCQSLKDSFASQKKEMDVVRACNEQLLLMCGIKSNAEIQQHKHNINNVSQMKQLPNQTTFIKVNQFNGANYSPPSITALDMEYTYGSPAGSNVIAISTPPYAPLKASPESFAVLHPKTNLIQLEKKMQTINLQPNNTRNHVQHHGFVRLHTPKPQQHLKMQMQNSNRIFAGRNRNRNRNGYSSLKNVINRSTGSIGINAKPASAQLNRMASVPMQSGFYGVSVDSRTHNFRHSNNNSTNNNNSGFRPFHPNETVEEKQQKLIVFDDVIGPNARAYLNHNIQFSRSTGCIKADPKQFTNTNTNVNVNRSPIRPPAMSTPVVSLHMHGSHDTGININISGFVTQARVALQRTKSMLILGEMDFTLASSIASIIASGCSNRCSKSNVNKNQTRSRMYSTVAKGKNYYGDFFATSYHNYIPSNRIVNKFCNNMKYTKAILLFHIFQECNMPDFKENEDLISGRVQRDVIEPRMNPAIGKIINSQTPCREPWRVCGGVDATNLDAYKIFQNKLFEKIVFGFPRTYVSYIDANKKFMKKTLASVKHHLFPKTGELHLLMHVSCNEMYANGETRHQFDTWNIMGKEVSNDEWTLVARETLSFDELQKLFPSYVPRTESGYSWSPDFIDYIILRPIHMQSSESQ